jgi:hypothetical protein
MWSRCTQKTMSMGLMVTAWGNKQASIKFQRKLTTPPSSPIQTILSALESHQILPKKQARGLEELLILHRRSGITPCPEDSSL